MSSGSLANYNLWCTFKYRKLYIIDIKIVKSNELIMENLVLYKIEYKCYL